jgi:hypothetical protein
LDFDVAMSLASTCWLTRIRHGPALRCKWFSNEKVRAEYLEAVPGFSDPVRTEEGILLASVADLVKMKLTGFRMKVRATR